MAMTPRLVRASSLSATYTAGIFCTETDTEAIEQAKEEYATSSLGRQMRDVGAFRFYVAGRGGSCYGKTVGDD